MPTLTLSWTDLALALLTAGVIGGAAIAGSQFRPGSSSLSTSTKNKPRAAKKKKSQAKKHASSIEPDPSPSPTPPELPSPALKEEETKKTKQPAPVRAAKAKSKKPAQNVLDDQEFPPLGASNLAEWPKPAADAAERPDSKPMRPFAERAQAPVRKTIVDDMIDKDVERPVQMARVMKIVEESPDSSSASESDAEDGWEKVSDGKKSRTGGKTMTLKMSSTTASVARPPGSANATAAASKRQRQNAKKKEAAKAAKAAEEAERLGRLSTHKRQQERVRMNEQAARSTSQTSKSKEVGGGMKASIGEDGRLIWE